MKILRNVEGLQKASSLNDPRAPAAIRADDKQIDTHFSWGNTMFFMVGLAALSDQVLMCKSSTSILQKYQKPTQNETANRNEVCCIITLTPSYPTKAAAYLFSIYFSMFLHEYQIQSDFHFWLCC